MRYTPAPIHPVTAFVRSLDALVWAVAGYLGLLCLGLMATVSVLGLLGVVR